MNPIKELFKGFWFIRIEPTRETMSYSFSYCRWRKPSVLTLIQLYFIQNSFSGVFCFYSKSQILFEMFIFKNFRINRG